jgi:predicted DNA-binding protein
MQSLDKAVIRLPDGMREEIKGLARSNRRSMNAEIVAAIERHIKASTGWAIEESRAQPAVKATA